MEEGGLTYGSVDDSQSRESGGATNDSEGDQTANSNGYAGELYNPEDESSSKGLFEWSAAANQGAEDSRQSNGDASMEQSQESFRKRSHSSSSSRNADDSESVAVKRLKTVVENMELPNEDDEEEGAKIWSALDPVRPDLSSSKLADLEKFWKPVMESPKDFQAWTSLLQYVDHESDVAAAREAYDLFLRRYPYCYGYWKKWADYEKKKATRKDCEKVFEMGIAAVPLSVDLWLHYLNYCRAQDADQVEFIREQFERAVAACGLEFRSDRLWEMYINWEVERDDLKRVFQIYDRLLAIPTQFHATHWENFQDLINQNNPKDLLSSTEYEELKKEATRSRKSHSDDSENTKSREDVVKSIRNRVRDRRLKVRIQTEKEITDRATFEESIKRPYFHVKPLEKGQLKNWKNYVEFEVDRGNDTRIRVLFERCLIACALNEEYWLMYAKYLESKYKENPSRDVKRLLKDVYRRACTIHAPDKPTMYLMWAIFEEKTGKYRKAERVLELLELACPKLETLIVRRVGLARRQGQFDKVMELYQQYIDKAGESEESIASLALRASRFAHRVLDSEVLAEELIEKALEKEPKNPRLYLQLFDLHFQKLPVDVAACLQALDRAIQSEMDLEVRCRFAERKVEFLEDFADDAFLLKQAQDELQVLRKEATPPAGDTHDTASEPGKTKPDAAAAGGYDASYGAGYGAAAGYQGYQGYPQGWGGYQQYGAWNQGYYQQ